MFPTLCPVHLYARHHCTYHCKPARLELQTLNSEYRKYWMERRRGVRVKRPGVLYGWAAKYSRATPEPTYGHAADLAAVVTP